MKLTALVASQNIHLETYAIGELRAQQTAIEWLWRYNHERPIMGLGDIAAHQMPANAERSLIPGSIENRGLRLYLPGHPE